MVGLGYHAGKDRDEGSCSRVTCKNRPRFIKVLQPDDLEKMRIPDKFVQQHLTEAGACLSSQNAMIVCPLGKFWRVKLDHGQSDVLCGDEWPQFVMAHDLSEGNILLFRYEGTNMVLSVQVFLPNGCLKEYHTTLALCTTDGARGPSSPLPQRPTAPAVSKKRKNDRHVVYAISAPVQPQSKPAAISPRHSFTKKITSFALRKHFPYLCTRYVTTLNCYNYNCDLFLLQTTNCDICFGACTVELKTSMRSWPVAFNVTKTYGYIKGKGWRRFCQDNEVEEGDTCTFKVVEKTVWLVVIK
ncbi:putative B3 domain-containing protein Os06g0632500 [Lolium rigidum]|uniref:putative B3 domain-containing protein Os06g0632500 n=1 Tax=Lolium rigidum TaxID=89674 RepID=UPI001F5C8182|nr:putative B3 domain-containing protein Os06g0632500 [Lolium rigidum]